MSRNIKYRIVLLPREHELKAREIKFPKLNDLFLHLIENKSKLKPGLPPVTEQVIIQKKSTEKKDTEKKDEVVDEEIEEETEDEEAPLEIKKKLKPEKKPPKLEEEDDLVQALGESEDEENEDEADEESDEDEIEEEVDEEKEDDEEKEEEVEDPYAGLTEEQRIEAETEDYRRKFRILKRKYPHPSVEIPDFTEYSDLPSMKRKYVQIEQELGLDDNIETARAVLFASFLIIEVAAVQMDIDLRGFTKSQMAMIDKYEKMLVEIGEKPYYSWTSNLPVEVKLAGFVLLQAFLFFIAKIVAEKYGERIGEFFSMIFGIRTPEKKKKKKMRGPSVTKEDIDNMSKID
ncbi:MAG TPA: hypothetical protein VLE02_00935 [Nitrosarchaeum sp.]|nr:hypothetical protein [Nitrosarchaeum sp.]